MNNNFYKQKFSTGEYGGGVYDLKPLLPLIKIPSHYQYLEVGVGKGRFLCDLVRALDVKPGRLCTGDLENNLESYVAEVGYPVEFSQIKLGTDPLPFSTDTFDLIACNHVLEHIFETEETLREFRRVLKPSGLCVISVPNIANWWSRFTFLFYGEQPLGLDTGTELVTDGLTPILKKRFQGFKPSGHIRGFTPRSLRDLCERCEFEFVGWWNQNHGFRNKIIQPMMGIVVRKKT